MELSTGSLPNNNEGDQEKRMTERISPTVRLRKLVRRLRTWRDRAGMRQDDVGTVLGWSTAKVSRYENAEQIPGPAEIIALATIYGVPDQERDQYMALAVQARQKGWWQRYGSETLASNFHEYVGLESEASHVREYTTDLIPGLLQTERYATALTQAWLPKVDSSVAAERASLRAQRQQGLHESEPLQLSTVIGEAALRQEVGGPEVMREQLQHLAAMAELPHVTIQVLPFSAGAVPALGVPFILLSFPDPEDPDVPFADYLTGCVYVEDEDEVTSYSLNYSALENDRALDPAASLTLISKLAEQL
ncbi:helix-turn-helix domain-containing protein [Haloactinomyces albus]|uniref:Transcriptional regulator with XRE-family HTH domain n=1 Tax=Haloactinomyces albus TaxID=1352928 RepID=A0AAE3ZA22_9ACTN|nr:helix-turn-helix transcriptional regulator [Haloactinomyces albus]MDR7300080.1 transcriptional regulator with XRE-family HTH domain [Haloactinomyces albus]